MSLSFLFFTDSSFSSALSPSTELSASSGVQGSPLVSPQGRPELLPASYFRGEVLRTLWGLRSFSLDLWTIVFLPKSLFGKEPRAEVGAWPRPWGGCCLAPVPGPWIGKAWEARFSSPFLCLQTETISPKSYCEIILGRVAQRLHPIGPPGDSGHLCLLAPKFIF